MSNKILFIDNGKHPEDAFNAKLTFWLPTDSPYGNFQQKGKVFARTAMGELRNNNFIIQSKAITDSRGAGYRVAQKGLECMAKLGEVNE